MCFSVSCFSKRMFVIICNDVKVKFAAVFSASVLGQETPFCFYIIPASGLFCRFSDDKIKRKMNGFYMGWQNYDRRYREENIRGTEK